MIVKIDEILGVDPQSPEREEILEGPIKDLERRVFKNLNFSHAGFSPTFRDLAEVFEHPEFGTALGRVYLIYTVQILDEMDKRGILNRSTKDWLEVGRFLAYSTRRTFYNGSLQFISEAVPALIYNGNITSQKGFMSAVGSLVNDVEAHSRPQRKGANEYSKVAEAIMTGRVRYG